MAYTINDVIGGISTPRIYKLEDNNRVTNGSVEDALSSEWQGAGYSRVLASAQSPAFESPHGDYVLKVDDDAGGSWERAFQSVNYAASLASKSFLLTLKVRASGSNHDVTIKFGSATTSGGAINNAKTLQVTVDTSYDMIVSLPVIFGGGVTDQYIRIELGGCISNVAATGIAFYDDIRVYEIEATYDLNQPNKWSQDWEEKKESEYELVGGKTRKVVEGFRYVLNMLYEYNNATEQAKIIEVTENGLNYVVPHIDSLFGSFMQWNGNFKNEYFFGRYDGHAVAVALKAIELEKSKPREVGAYFAVT